MIYILYLKACLYVNKLRGWKRLHCIINNLSLLMERSVSSIVLNH